MLTTPVQIGFFIAFNLVIVGACVASVGIMWREKRREPRAEWASTLRESINGRFERYSAELDGIRDTVQRFTEVDEREKRHFASLSKQIRDNIELDEDEVTQTIVHVVHQYMRSMQIQNAQRPQPQERVAYEPPTADISSTSNGIPGLRSGDAPESG